MTPRDEEMRPSGTLQSPTTGSLEAMITESDREDQLAAGGCQQKNACNGLRCEPATIWPASNSAELAQTAVAVDNHCSPRRMRRTRRTRATDEHEALTSRRQRLSRKQTSVEATGCR